MVQQNILPTPTTRLRSTPQITKRSTKELAEADGSNTDVRSKEQAINFLQNKEFLAPGTQTDLVTLAHILFQLSVPTARTPKPVTDGVRAVAFLVADAAAQQMANEIVLMVKTQLQDHLGDFNNSVETMRDAVEHVSGATTELTDKIDEFNNNFHDVADQLTETTLELSQSVQDLAKKPQTHTKEAQKHNDYSTPTVPTTYASVTRASISPEHVDVVARSNIADKQLLVLADKNSPSSPPSDLTEKDLVTKANLALELMDDLPNNKPNTVTFITTKKLRNDNVLFQLNSAQATAWLRHPETQKAFTLTYSSNATIETDCST